jgi:hypothetical protein
MQPPTINKSRYMRPSLRPSPDLWQPPKIPLLSSRGARECTSPGLRGKFLDVCYSSHARYICLTRGGARRETHIQRRAREHAGSGHDGIEVGRILADRRLLLDRNVQTKRSQHMIIGQFAGGLGFVSQRQMQQMRRQSPCGRKFARCMRVKTRAGQSSTSARIMCNRRLQMCRGHHRLHGAELGNLDPAMLMTAGLVQPWRGEDPRYALTHAAQTAYTATHPTLSEPGDDPSLDPVAAWYARKLTPQASAPQAPKRKSFWSW